MTWISQSTSAAYFIISLAACLGLERIVGRISHVNVKFAPPEMSRERRQAAGAAGLAGYMGRHGELGDASVIDAVIIDKSQHPEIIFAATSFMDANKQANEAYLTGASWMARQHDGVQRDATPILWISLGARYNLCGLILSGRPTWPNDYTTKLRVDISDDNVTWVPATDRMHDKTIIFKGIVSNGLDFVTRFFKEPILGAYMRLSMLEPIPGAAVAIRMAALKDCIYKDPCTDGSNPCLNGGACDTVYGIASCQCPVSWTGDYCQTEVREKVVPSVACQNIATGQQQFRNCFCSCPDGWQFGLNDTQIIDAYQFDCDDKLVDIYNFVTKPEFQAIAIKCPQSSTCSDVNYIPGVYPVWGDRSFFTVDSAVCRAALQAFGPQEMYDGKILQVYKLGEMTSFQSDSNNNVQSFPYGPFMGATFHLTVVQQMQTGRGR